MTREKKLKVTIDSRKLEVRSSITILEAARESDVYIPSLCTLKHLPSYGACRLCIVEVDGLRGYPTSCTTPIEEGMVIRTDTAELRSLRQEILKLLLSEHPASCLFCEEHDECKEFQGTIRKVGVTTGCRYCPNDARCELQEITEKVGLTETSYPVYYRGFPVEKHDPFYDRDYNLCILCGRCVRVCNSVRLNGTLSFKQRGKLTTIGPAFDRTHLEAGCEFCGACVSVCPTGALSTKVAKWYGKPDSRVATTCLYCPAGCRLELQVKNNEVIDVLPDYDSPVDQGLICVKGRFAIPEYVVSPERLGTPSRLTPVGYEVISWDQAIDEATERLGGAGPEDSLVMVSPQLSNEDLFVVQQFTRQVLGSDIMISSMMVDLGNDLVPFLELVTNGSTFDAIEGARGILTVGFDSTYGYSPVGTRIKKAAQEGAVLVTLGACDSNLDMLSETAFQTDPSRWAEFMGTLTDCCAKGGKGKTKAPKEWAGDIERISRAFSDSSINVLVVGPQAIFSPGRQEVFEKVRALRDKLGWKVIVAHPYTNLLGMLAMGAFPGVKPGELLKDDGVSVAMDLPVIDLTKRKKVVYLIGEGRFDIIPDCDYLIYQNGLPPASSRRPDLILPAGLFTESSGTTTNGEGRVLAIEKATEPFMDAKPDWWILSRIAEKANKGRVKYKDVAAIRAAIRKQVKGFYSGRKPLEFVRINAEETTKWLKRAPKQEGQSRVGNNPSYRGIPLARVVAGMKVIDEWVNTSLLSDKEAQ
ncbi:molybdopterin-dependent oxidoreductase [Syntrophorhabdus aromaticivorans]|uniref:Molybdopterin-dependent oxidoreductase n=1 Tax=Syntrophorhabdus aromaticivorans TaxID=328301 RepID=A0A971S1K3_9BACT|nr:molybdopterin-dependent oxidoreductase [Syntrophorhabdus aromaticivorans]NLW35327.1 molybdopterin-dependent oxidoreductase [Syntrophorhabdus aromaticivorans]